MSRTEQLPGSVRNTVTSKKTMDRRAVRTRAMLQRGLSALLRKKRYETITINDICIAADVGRSTFYAHYKSKDDLKRSGLDSLHNVLAQRQKAAQADADDVRDSSFDFSLAVFAHARDHLDHYRTLAGSRGGAVALTKVREMVSDLMRRELASTVIRHSTEDIPPEAAVEYAVGAYMALLTWWLDSGAKLPPQRMGAIFRCLTTHGIR